ncbi:hypothetical protein CCE12_12350 [Escherichia coli]|nr:hypothetical protein CCE12_12350 [Escherichia coli]OWH13632.1 hypothetical protein CCE10_12260 [Escherichia coli]
MRHFADIVGFLILHQLRIIARNVAQFHGNCLVALVYRWSLRVREGANKRENSSRLTQSFHFFMFEPIFSPVNALNQPI